jgi:hypothetical protein
MIRRLPIHRARNLLAILDADVFGHEVKEAETFGLH